MTGNKSDLVKLLRTIDEHLHEKKCTHSFDEVMEEIGVES